MVSNDENIYKYQKLFFCNFEISIEAYKSLIVHVKK